LPPLSSALDQRLSGFLYRSVPRTPVSTCESILAPRRPRLGSSDPHRSRVSVTLVMVTLSSP
jgi:hypothetical protein